MMISVLCVAGCGLVPGGGDAPGGAAVAPQTGADGQLRPQTRPADAAVVASTAEGARAATPEVSAGTLGRTVASLGNAAEPGLWLKTPLVGATRQGRVHFPTTGKSVNVTLIPIEGPATAGSRLSLAAMRGLGASLTDLVEVDVFGS